jgi:hypothetical protein
MKLLLMRLPVVCGTSNVRPQEEEKENEEEEEEEKYWLGTYTH